MRARGRIARAAQLLASCDHALSELERQAKNDGGKAADVLDVLLGNEVRKIYAERMGFGAFDNNTDGFIPDEPAADPAADAAQPVTSDDA